MTTVTAELRGGTVATTPWEETAMPGVSTVVQWVRDAGETLKGPLQAME